ncbi:hypothetical protein VTI74DRAFT_4395 [Chaetomium olivicolor]
MTRTRSDDISFSHFQVSTPASRTPTRPSTAGRTTSITTSASSPRARTSRPAASSGSPTGPCAPAVGTSGGMSSGRLATSLSVLTSKGCVEME